MLVNIELAWESNPWDAISPKLCFYTIMPNTTRCNAIAGRTAGCHCTFRYVSNFTTASCGFSATARLSCTGLHQRPFKCWNYTKYADFHGVIVTLVLFCTISEITSVLFCTVSEILQVFVLLTHPYSTLILGVFPLHQITHVGVSPSKGLKLFGREIIFNIFQPVWKT